MELRGNLQCDGNGGNWQSSITHCLFDYLADEPYCNNYVDDVIDEHVVWVDKVMKE